MGHPIIPNHTRFHDGTVYCDGGREVVRRLFHWYHRDDQTICMTETYRYWPGGIPESAFPGVQCTSPVVEPSRGGTAALMRLWAEAKSYQTTLPEKPQDALCCVVGEEFYQGSTQGL
jgi:hypothetical protein